MPIYRNKERGCYVFEFDNRIGGRRVRTTKTLPRTWTRAQADAFNRRESDRLYAITHGIGPEPDIEAAVTSYLTHRTPHLKAQHEIEAELNRLMPLYQGRPLSALPDVCKAIAIKQKGLAPATIRKRIRYLTSACRWAWKHEGMGEHDPAARVMVPSVHNERQVYVDRQEMLKICRACPDRTVRAAIRLAFYTGWRISEVIRAKRTGTALLLTDSKNNMPRMVPLHPRVRSAANVPLYSAWHISKKFRAAADKVGLVGVRFHDLRHSAASAMINAGVDLYTVGAVLGHKSAASTKRYAHLNPASLEGAIGKIGRKVA